MTPPAEEQLVRRLTRRKELKARESLSHDPIFIEREVTYSLLVSDPLTVMDFEVLGLRLSLKQLELICKIQHRDMSYFPYCMYETSQNIKVFCIIYFNARASLVAALSVSLLRFVSMSQGFRQSKCILKGFVRWLHLCCRLWWPLSLIKFNLKGRLLWRICHIINYMSLILSVM